jgi:hypothetical protein
MQTVVPLTASLFYNNWRWLSLLSEQQLVYGILYTVLPLVIYLDACDTRILM